MTIQLKRQSGVSLRKNTLACSVKQLDRHMCLKMLQKLLLSHTSDVHMSNMLFVNETERLLLHVLLQLFILLISPYFYIFFSFFNHSFCNMAVLSLYTCVVCQPVSHWVRQSIASFFWLLSHCYFTRVVLLCALWGPWVKLNLNPQRRLKSPWKHTLCWSVYLSVQQLTIKQAISTQWSQLDAGWLCDNANCARASMPSKQTHAVQYSRKKIQCLDIYECVWQMFYGWTFAWIHVIPLCMRIPPGGSQA